MTNPSDKSFTYRAATTALPFTLISIIFDLIKHFTQELPALAAASSFLKLGIVTAVLYWCMKKFTSDEGYVPYGRSFRFGFSICTFSAIICTLWSVLNIYIIFPDQLDVLMETLSTAIEQAGMNFDYDMMVRYVPAALIISSFISCLIWGLILSGILANFTKNDSPFADDDSQDKLTDDHTIDNQ